MIGLSSALERRLRLAMRLCKKWKGDIAGCGGTVWLVSAPHRNAGFFSRQDYAPLHLLGFISGPLRFRLVTLRFIYLKDLHGGRSENAAIENGDGGRICALRGTELVRLRSPFSGYEVSISCCLPVIFCEICVCLITIAFQFSFNAAKN